jgi:hypothetical protein
MGPAEDTPAALSRLLDDDIAVRAKALRHLDQTVRHGNTICSATVPSALYVAAILADPRAATSGIYRRDDTCRPLRAVLLDWLGEIATDIDDHSVSIMERIGSPLAEYPEMVELRTERPAIFRAVHTFLNDSDPTVRDAAVITAALLVDNDPELVGRRAVLTPSLNLLVTSSNRIYRACAVDTLTAWGEPVPPNAASLAGQSADPPF